MVLVEGGRASGGGAGSGAERAADKSFSTSDAAGSARAGFGEAGGVVGREPFR